MLGRLLRRIWYLLNRRRLERELEREMAAHRAEIGEPHRFGGTLRLREQAADVWGWMWLDDLWHDLRYGLRQLRRTPGFALVAVLTLAVGIGANTTAFGIVNTTLFAELPVPEPGALRQFEWAGDRQFSETTFRSLYNQASGFSSLTCVSNQARVALGRGDRYEQAQAVLVSGAFVRTFGFTTAIGRPLTPADNRAGAPPVAVISHEAWQRHFGGAASAVGSVVTVDDSPVTIVGVLQHGFSMSVGRRPPDLVLPMAPARQAAAGGSPPERSCRIIGRLSEERNEELTRQESERLLRWSGLPLPLDREPPRLRESLRLGLRPVGRGIDDMGSGALENDLPQIAGALFLLLSVLIVPCANVAAILLARAITRRQEIVARLALGASRARLVRQLLTEGALLSVLAGTLGVLISSLLVSNLAATATTELPRQPPFVLDAPVLAMTAALCALATLAFALAPALTATRGDLASRIRESSAGAPSRPRSAPGTMLVAVQVLVSCVLLAVAVLQARALLDPAPSMPAEPERVLLVEVDPGRATGELVEDAVGRLTRVPGVVSAAAASSDGLYVTFCETADARAGRETRVSLWAISPSYFATLGIPLEHGRELAWADRRAGGVAVISDSLARSLFGRVDPVGQRLPLVECPGSQLGPLEPLTIVGVVNHSMSGAVWPAIYLPYTQLATAGVMRDLSHAAITFAARSGGNASALAKPVRQALQQSAPGVTVGAMQTLAERLTGRGSGPWTLTAVYVLLALLATGQAAFGLYGTVSQFVNRRTAEIGVRMVLGARTPDVVRLVIRQTLVPVLIGLLTGLACSPIVANVMYAARLTGDVGWGELLAVSAAISMVMLAAFAASSAPLWRVSRIDPASALRED